MNPAVILGAACIAASLPLLFWSLFGAPGSEKQLTASDLVGPMPTDLREAVLAKSATERALRPALVAISGTMRKITPAGRIEALDQRRAMAGLPASWTIEKLLTAKVVLGVAGAVFCVTKIMGGPSTKGLLLALAAPVLGFFLPDILLKNQADKRQQQIALEMADILDQITVGVEAGLGFDSALSRTARSAKGPLAEELARTLQHVSAGLTRAEALRGLASRNKVPELRQFVNAVLQADQYGIPMAQVLRVQATEQRRKRRQRAEEKAMKLPVKVLFPLVLFILPAIFVVLVGPAGLRIANSM